MIVLGCTEKKKEKKMKKENKTQLCEVWGGGVRVSNTKKK